MSKKAKEPKVETEEKAKPKKNARDEYKDCFLDIPSFIGQDRTVIPFSTNLDLILGGGIPLGSFVVIAGQKKLGKTTSILHFCANAQKAGCKIYYLDVEHRIKPRDFKGIPGLSFDKDKFELIHSTKKKLLHGEDYLSIAMDLLETEEKCVIILDSVSQLCSSGKAAANIGDRFRDDIPSMLSTMTKRASNILPVNGHIMICVTHMIANQGGNGPAMWLEASGQKIQYQADVKLRVTHKTDVTDSDEKQVGQLMHWQCDTAAIGPPGGKTTTLLRYGEGLDDYYDLLSSCIDIGLVTQKASWIIFSEDIKAQGKENARNVLKANPELYNNLLKQFRELLI